MSDTPENVKAYLRQLGSKGGRTKGRSKARPAKQMRQAAMTRWQRVAAERKAQKAQFARSGPVGAEPKHATVKIGEYTVPLIGVPPDATECKCSQCGQPTHLSKLVLDFAGEPRCPACVAKTKLA